MLLILDAPTEVFKSLSVVVRLLNVPPLWDWKLLSLTAPPTLATPAENPGILIGILVVGLMSECVFGSGLENVGCWVESRPPGLGRVEAWMGVKRGGLVGRDG